MNVAELERLLEQVTQGNWSVDGSYVTSDAMHEMDCVAESHRYDGEYDLQLMALAPSLARRVIAAERLVGAINSAVILEDHDPECGIDSRSCQCGVSDIWGKLRTYEATK